MENVSFTLALITLCFLIANARWPNSLDSCFHDLATTMRSQTGSQSKPVLPQHFCQHSLPQRQEMWLKHCPGTSALAAPAEFRVSILLSILHPRATSKLLLLVSCPGTQSPSVSWDLAPLLVNFLLVMCQLVSSMHFKRENSNRLWRRQTDLKSRSLVQSVI